ncbi:hypothetical protein C8A05DRAFT_33843 [Staphylotrichum tortipilum]|uniref:HCNGP-like protein n=1 Tax=Staphylotrichum tortipilum TaxID=2831512 RepID=A0AAN6RTJ5_9PEZI|nr:hypothetical protein C8A05DRAFT_33843 [Staphylotrichum longicolle]
MGLVQYDSSDEDEDVQSPAESTSPNPTAKPSLSSTQTPPTPAVPSAPPVAPASLPIPVTAATASTASPPAPGPAPGPASDPTLGPVLGPSRPPPTTQQTAEPSEEIDLSFLDPTTTTTDTTGDPPRSPYTTTRALLRDLTLPTHAELSIPPSPPGSPPPGHAALTTKFDTFLRLKRTQGVHFNERLAGARGMANPATADKLLSFVGLGSPPSAGEGREEDDGGGGGGGCGGDAEAVGRGYATVLGAEVWDPACFPAWAYKGALRREQERGRKERERGRGEKVEFVKGGVVGGEDAGRREGTPGVGGGKRKGRWD